jgi:hypothetical protein
MEEAPSNDNQKLLELMDKFKDFNSELQGLSVQFDGIINNERTNADPKLVEEFKILEKIESDRLDLVRKMRENLEERKSLGE